MRKVLLTALALTLLPLAALTPGTAATKGGIEYVAVPNGDGSTTEIAVQAYFPTGYVAGTKLPTLVQVEGYGGAGQPNDGSFVDDPDYIVLAVSLRGTGCSAGTLELFSDRSSKDVAWIIDNWIPAQGWSNGDIGIYGHSYGGLTGFLVASFVKNDNLKAVAVSGLIDDFYRGILYPGGISNYGFPILWGAGVRPALEHAGNASSYPNARCAANFAQHLGSDVVPPPQIALDTYGSPFAKDPLTGNDTWSIRQALVNHIDNPDIGAKIQVPTQLGQQYQDEQTGPRGGHVLWEALPDTLPKRIQISTGRHNPNDPMRTKKDWLDCWVIHGGITTATTRLGTKCSDVLDPAKRVLLAFEQISPAPTGQPVRPPFYTASDWPLPATDWQRYKLCATGSLVDADTADASCTGEVTYASTSLSRHMTGDAGLAVPYGLAAATFTNGLPDTARYTLSFNETGVLAGPLELSLWATLSTPDNNFWVEVLDRDTATGATTFVQRGMLRAAANGGFVEALSDKTPGGDIYRPYYTYEELTLVEPGTPQKYEIEIFPLGHVWRAGHELVLQLHAPPANDPISTYAYLPTTPSVVTILQDPAHPTTILLPFLQGLDPKHYRATPPTCGRVNGEVCVTPALG